MKGGRGNVPKGNEIPRSPANFDVGAGSSFIEEGEQEEEAATPGPSPAMAKPTSAPGEVWSASINEMLAYLVSQGDRIEKKFDNVDARLEKNSADIKRLDKNIRDTKSSINAAVEASLDERLTGIHERLQSLES